MNSTRLDNYDNSWYDPGGGKVKRLLWFYTSLLFFQSGILPVNAIKVFLLRLFGARVGKGVVIKPAVQIKYPWKLTLGNHCWIGEKVWIDNLAEVKLGNHVCLSQGAMLLTGNHDYKKPGFDLIIGEILLEDGAWIGARALVCPGVTCASHAVLSAQSVASKNLDAYTVYAGNPAEPVRKRTIEAE